jgi:hypothetical protein
MSAGDPNRTVEAQRRRKATTPPSQRQTAETPQRRESSGGGGGGARPSGGMGLPLPGGRGPATIGGMILFVLILCIYFGFQLLGGGGETEQAPLAEPITQEQNLEQPDFEEPVAQAPEAVEPPGVSGQLAAAPTIAPFESYQPPAPALTQPPAAAVTGQTWTVMLYQDADDKILEQDIYLDLNEAELVGSSERVNIVAQIDRYQGGYTGDGDWTGTRRFYLTQDDDLSRVRSKMVADLGEAPMADPRTLVDFVTWAAKNYPADRYVLILSDHGMGWPGGWTDSTPARRSGVRAPLASRLGSALYLNEIDDALAQVRSATGIDQFELVGMDACLMGQVEVFSALAPHARYAVASQEVEPALGWAYASFLEALQQDPDMDGAELGRLIVDSYIEQDQRIVDRQARAEFLRQGSPMGGLFGPPTDVSPQQLARQIGQGSTLTAVDLSAWPGMEQSINNLAYNLQSGQQQNMARARTYAQPFTSIFGDKVPPSYIDLGHFLQLVKESKPGGAINQAADGLLAAISQVVIAEKHGPKKPGASGLTIFFPNSQLYQNPVTGAESYIAIAGRFVAETLWDDFLAYHYTGEQFSQSSVNSVIPQDLTSVRAPGAGTITISAVSASSQTASPGQPVTLSADISGDNIGYIYLFVGFYDRTANSIFVADSDFLESADTREIDGVYYPDWGEGDFTLKFEWEPVVFNISDGKNSFTALFDPQSYGRSFEEAVYTVDGTYTYADSGDQRSARLVFVNGVMRQVFGFTGEDGTGAPRQIIPSPGDTFTIQETWLDLDQSGNVSAQATQQGGTLTFGNEMFTWQDLNAAPGEYMVGYIVEDMDGNRTQAFTQIIVK